MLTPSPGVVGFARFFGKAHTDYDFDARDSEQAVRRMNKLDAKLNKLAKTLNKKVVGMIETAEKEYTELMKKKRIIENDKSKIEVGCHVHTSPLWPPAHVLPAPHSLSTASHQGVGRDEEQGAGHHL